MAAAGCHDLESNKFEQGMIKIDHGEGDKLQFDLL